MNSESKMEGKYCSRSMKPSFFLAIFLVGVFANCSRFNTILNFSFGVTKVFHSFIVSSGLVLQLYSDSTL